MHRLLLGLSFPIALVAQSPNATNVPIAIALDAIDAPRHILHAKLSIPAKPGALTLVYPKWIPGEHGPTGPVTDLVNLRFTANGKALAWRRDLVDMYARAAVDDVGGHWRGPRRATPQGPRGGSSRAMGAPGWQWAPDREISIRG